MVQLNDTLLEVLDQRAVESGRNPRDVKFELAREIVARFHSQAAAEREQQAFIARFSEKEIPADIPLITLHVEAAGIKLANLLKDAGLAASTSEANRKISENAVRIDGTRSTDRGLTFAVGEEHIFQVGPRRLARIKLALKPLTP